MFTVKIGDVVLKSWFSNLHGGEQGWDNTE